MARNPASQPRLQTRPKGVAKSTRQDRMRKVIAAGGVPDGGIKVQLDERTVITLRNTVALDFWRKRYPNLQVL